jgi:hypothetical protein
MTSNGCKFRSSVDRLPPGSRAEEQWPSSQEVDQRDPDAEEGAFSYSSTFDLSLLITIAEDTGFRGSATGSIARQHKHGRSPSWF